MAVVSYLFVYRITGGHTPPSLAERTRGDEEGLFLYGAVIFNAQIIIKLVSCRVFMGRLFVLFFSFEASKGVTA
jgi:hypothetical protein